ncbi:hypothetical protein Lepto7375DRAFT_7299 [Leptolyngbya sp. PCC 7375]|nr:hypothetical protein Lepto7375DRAFT_7299 [Leptolyngbya sp. PCC 7375]
MSKLLPFVNKPLEEIEIVGSDRTGLLHLVSLKGVTPNENPADFQEQQKKQQKFLLRLTQRIKQLAKEQNVPIKEMRKKVMGAMTPERTVIDYDLKVFGVERNEVSPSGFRETVCLILVSDGWYVCVFDSNKVIKRIRLDESNSNHQYLLGYIENNFKGFLTYPNEYQVSKQLKQRILKSVSLLSFESSDTEVVDDDENELFDYLDEQTAELLFSLQEDKARLAIRAATFMLKYRVVYPVVALANSVAGSKHIHVQPPQAPIEKNVSVRFGPHKYAETTELLVPGFNQTDTLHVDELPFEIKDGDVGFICQPGSINLKIGFPDWTEQDTRDNIPEELIALLFQFYQKEAGIVTDTDDSDDSVDNNEGNLLTPSQNQLEQSPSTGDESTTDSNGLESQTNGSTAKTLETNPVG